MTKSIHSIALLNLEKRNLDKLSFLTSSDVYGKVSQKLLNLPRGVVFLVTGFFCFNSHETDGPIGTLFLSLALKKLGFTPIVLTESFSKGVYEKYDTKAIYIDQDMTRSFYGDLLANHSPVALISIERAGRDYNGNYNNMLMKDISSTTVNLDEIFLIENNIYKIAIGDGGNEIGMGNVLKHIGKDFGIIPSCVKADDLIIATVSNWGAYGLIAMLEYFSNLKLMPSFCDIEKALEFMNNLGLIDGITGKKGTIDSFELETDRQILDEIKKRILELNQESKFKR